jgi:hypothetical protein
MAKCLKCDYPYATYSICPNCNEKLPTVEYAALTDKQFSYIIGGAYIILCLIFFIWLDLKFIDILLSLPCVYVLFTKKIKSKIVKGLLIIVIIFFSAFLISFSKLTNKKFIYNNKKKNETRSIEFIDKNDCVFKFKSNDFDENISGSYEIDENKIIFNWKKTNEYFVGETMTCELINLNEDKYFNLLNLNLTTNFNLEYKKNGYVLHFESINYNQIDNYQ